LSLAALLALAALSAAGCKSNGNQELLERELRNQENTIYDLQSEVEDAQQRLESCRRENSELKREVQGGGPAAPGGDPSTNPPRGPGRLPPDIDRLPDAPRRPRSDITVPDLPKIDLGTPAPPADSAPPSDSSAPGTRASSELSAPPLLNAINGDPHATEGSVRSSGNNVADDAATNEPMPPMSSPEEVRRIAINRLMSGSHSYGSRPGDDGVRVVFTARDEYEHPILAPGAVSVVVVDPEVVGAESRVARWDFSAEETAAHFRPGTFAKGYHFDLIWPDHPPAHDRVKMYVRFSTPDGRNFEAQQTIHIASAADAKRWSMVSPVAAPQQWEASSTLLGAQFDPAVALPHDTADGLRVVTSPATSTPPATVASTPASAPNPSAPPAAPQSARSTRPVWSPYR
jgi:hypothetical protein